MAGSFPGGDNVVFALYRTEKSLATSFSAFLAAVGVTFSKL